MSSVVTSAERAAIAAYRGEVKRCPEGAAKFAHLVIMAAAEGCMRADRPHSNGAYEQFFAVDERLSVTSITPTWSPNNGSKPESRREHILRMYGAGLNTAQIAERLMLTENFVRKERRLARKAA